MITPEKETRKTTVPSTNPDYKEMVYVLKSDPSVRHGEYRLVYRNVTLVTGFYNMGLRDSLWQQFNQAGQLKISGCYSGDNRIGIWKFYDNEKNLEQEIDMTNQAVLFYKTKYSQHPFKIIDGTDTLVAVLDRPPLYIGGSSRINDFISRELVLPLHKSKDNVKGTVFVEFLISSDGMTSQFRVLKGISSGCNAEALRVVRLLPNEWIPGVLKERNISVFYTIPVRFDEKVQEFDPGLLLTN
jgi:hypothetical protein